MTVIDRELASRIDHTLLAPVASIADVDRVCDEAIDYGFAAVVVQPVHACRAVKRTAGVLPVCSVVSFPFGAHDAAQKTREAAYLREQGVREIDAVMNIGAFVEGQVDVVRREVEDIVRVCDGLVTKFIIEVAYLTPEQVSLVTDLMCQLGVTFVKTSTGYASRGATVDDVRIMVEAARGRAGIKAAGGIRTRAFAEQLIAAGAARLGSSASLDLVKLENE
jgi:deoxyribose-phosphate aldolase